MGTKGKDNNFDSVYGPGPGTYNPNDNAIMKYTSGQTMGAKNSSDNHLLNVPGPGSYNFNSNS